MINEIPLIEEFTHFEIENNHRFGCSFTHHKRLMSLEYPLHYDAGYINRSAELRKDHDHLMSLIHSENSLIAPVWKDLNLIRNHDKGPQLSLQKPTSQILENSSQEVFLGRENGHLIFSVDLSSQEDISPFLNAEEIFEDLRKVGPSLPSSDASLAVFSRGIHYWHKTHRYCSRCGQPTVSTEGGHSRTCSNPKCQHTTYPRISPAVIVLVEHQPQDGSPTRCLLGKGQRAWGNIRSTLAGFVEVGESLEETVRREMKEEAGIEVDNIRYIASQPWPFPSSLMVGFFAEARNPELTIDTDEILEARWYTLEEMDEMVKSGDLVLSREDSIARFLIKKWMKAQRNLRI